MNKKLRKVFNKKSIFIFILGGLVFGISGVGATSLLYSRDVTYDNGSSGMSATTVQAALDELYAKAKSAPECDSNGNCTVICPSGTEYITTSTGYRCGKTARSTLLENVVTSGNGLYADSATSERYIYRGSSVNNYITFNSETWRIISVESDGTIKIIRNEQLSSAQQWDATNNRNSSTSTYCTDAISNGCNAWAATSNLVGTPSTFIQYYAYGNPSNYEAIYSGTVTQDASLNTYLNGTYYNSLTSTAQSQVVKGTFNVSTPGYWSDDTETLDVDANQEKQYQWQGYVALMTVTELLKASTSTGCTSLFKGYNNGNTSTCKSNNWLWPTFGTTSWEFTLSPYVNSGRYSVWYVERMYISYTIASNTYGVRPVLYLSSNIGLSGSGTSSDPYTITG